MSEGLHSESLKVFLFRHPQTDWNAARRYQGLTDRPWSPAGITRTDQLVDEFEASRFDTIIHSPRTHAHRLAQSLAEKSVPTIQDDRWAEIDHGKWEGLTYEEVSRQFPDSCKERFLNPLTCESHGGETLQAIFARVTEAWETLPNTVSGTNIAVMTHATPIQLVLCQITGLPIERYWQFQIDCGSVTSLEITSGGTIINYSNHT